MVATHARIYIDVISPACVILGLYFHPSCVRDDAMCSEPRNNATSQRHRIAVSLPLDDAVEFLNAHLLS